MRIRKIIIKPRLAIVLENGRKFGFGIYRVLGHGRGIHVPKEVPASLQELGVKELFAQLKECLEERKRTPRRKHDPHAGYYGVYIYLAKSLLRYRIQFPKEFVYDEEDGEKSYLARY